MIEPSRAHKACSTSWPQPIKDTQLHTMETASRVQQDQQQQLQVQEEEAAGPYPIEQLQVRPAR